MTTVVSVAQGGTGSNSAALARTALGVPPSAAYDQANTARDQANTARTQANSAYAQANSAYSDANTRLSASGGTLAGDLIITGNLTVSGNSTTLNAEILTIEDADVVLLSNVASTPALNAGIIVNRGTSTNTFLRWDEVTDKWGWSDDGSTTYKFNSALDAYAQANSAYGAANNRVLKAGDTMTGQLNISAGGLLVTGNSNFDSGTLFVDSVNDRIGVGTTNPSEKFQVDDTTPAVALRIQTSNTGNSANNYSEVQLADNGAVRSYWRQVRDGSGAVIFSYNDHLRFYQQSTEVARLTLAGNFGIGTTSPGSKLSVRGTTDLGDSHDSTTSSLHTTRLSGYALRYDASNRYGNYGVLIFSASHGWTSSAKRFMITNGINANKFCIIRSVDGLTDPTLGDAGSITSGTADFTIDSSGNIGISTTNPGAKLHVSGGGIRIPANTWIDSENSVNLIRDGRFGYSDSYRVVQIGINSGTRAISLGYDPSVNLSGAFNGGEIIIPNNRAIIAPTSDNSTYIGVLRVDSANNLCIGGGNYQTSGYIFVNNTTGNVGIGTASPTAPLFVQHTNLPGEPYSGIIIKNTDTTGAAFTGVTADGVLQSHYRFALNGSTKWQWRCGAGSGIDDLRLYSFTLGDDVMTVNNSGQIKFKYQPRFYAYGNVGGTHASGSFVRYGYTYVNVGSHYSSTNGRFTAPVTGDYYLFWGSIAAAASDVYRFYLYKNGADTGVQLRIDTTATGSEYGTNGSRAIILSLAQNDYVQIYYAADAGTSFYPAGDESSPAFTHFGGYLLG